MSDSGTQEPTGDLSGSGTDPETGLPADSGQGDDVASGGGGEGDRQGDDDASSASGS